MEDELEVQGPLVFSCLACRTIVGDTLSLSSTNSDLQSVTLTGASNILRQDDLITSKTGADKGSTFFVIECQTCHKTLGKYYITTPRNLDEVREKFTLLIDHISSYELGKVQHGSIIDPAVLSQFAQAPKSSLSKQSVTQEEEPPVASTPAPVLKTEGPTTEELEEELAKVQHVIMDLLYRVSELEKTAVNNTRSAVNLAPRGGDMYAAYHQHDHQLPPQNNYPMDNRPPQGNYSVMQSHAHQSSPQSQNFSLLSKRKDFNTSQEVDNPILAKRPKNANGR